MRIAHNKCAKCGTHWHKKYKGGDNLADPLTFGYPDVCPKCGHNYYEWLNYPPEEEENKCRVCAQFAAKK